MSSGITNDVMATKRQINKPNPCIDGKTWLRHAENAQSGRIDLMVLEGNYSTEEMVRELKRIKYFKDDASLDQCILRVKDHLDHLTNGSPRSLAHGQNPHHLKLKEVSGKWRFDID